MASLQLSYWSRFGLLAMRVFYFPEQGCSVGLDIAKRSCARGNIGKAKWLNELEDREGRLAGLPPFSAFYFSDLHLTDVCRAPEVFRRAFFPRPAAVTSESCYCEASSNDTVSGPDREEVMCLDPHGRPTIDIHPLSAVASSRSL
jgi:hypothetical protein